MNISKITKINWGVKIMNITIKVCFIFLFLMFWGCTNNINNVQTDNKVLDIKKDVKHCSRDIKNYSIDEEPCYYGFVTEDDYVRPTQSKKWAAQCFRE